MAYRFYDLHHQLQAKNVRSTRHSDAIIYTEISPDVQKILQSTVDQIRCSSWFF